MGAILNGKEIHGGFLNGKMLFESVKDGSWIECPTATGVNAWDGLTFMKFDPSKSSADFITSAHGYIDNSTDRIAITLPESFQFLDSPNPTRETLRGYMQTDAYNSYESSWDFDIKYTKTQMLIHNNMSISGTIYLGQYSGQLANGGVSPLFEVGLTVNGITKI